MLSRLWCLLGLHVYGNGTPRHIIRCTVCKSVYQPKETP